MNLGLENLRELLTTFLSNTGGRRGRQREQQRERVGGGDATAASAGMADPSTGDGMGSATTDAEDMDAPASDPSFERESRPDPDDLDDDEVVDDLYHRIESLEDDLEQSSSKLGTIQDSQEQVAGQVEDVNDRIRELLGIYDRLTDDVNPFTGEGEEKGGFGVFDTEDGERDGEPGGSDSRFGLFDDRDQVGEDETVSFEDLKTVLAEAADEPQARKIPFSDEEPGEHGDDDDTNLEVQPTGDVGDDETGTGSGGGGQGPAGGDSASAQEASEADAVTLSSLPETYAADVVIFEWLTDLVRTGGTAASLRAISYYAEIGWIDEDVRAHLESVLSGPDLDIHVDPETMPDELTAEDHADSYTYIMTLSEIHQTKEEVDS